MQAELSSLQALQRVVLGEEGKDVSKWLDEHGLSKAPRLMDQIKNRVWMGSSCGNSIR